MGSITALCRWSCSHEVLGPTGLLVCRKSTLNVHISNDLAQADRRDQDTLGLLLQPGARSKPGAGFGRVWPETWVTQQPVSFATTTTAFNCFHYGPGFAALPWDIRSPFALRSCGFGCGKGARRRTAGTNLPRIFLTLVIDYFPFSPMEFHHENEDAVNLDRCDWCCVSRLGCEFLRGSKYKNAQMYGCAPKAVGNE
jgi:hypothetical protein